MTKAKRKKLIKKYIPYVVGVVALIAVYFFFLKATLSDFQKWAREDNRPLGGADQYWFDAYEGRRKFNKGSSPLENPAIARNVAEWKSWKKRNFKF